MYKEPSTIETVEKQEAHENHEAPVSVESPEKIREHLMDAATQEATHFTEECAEDFRQAEVRAEKDGLTVDAEDKNALQELGAEADGAKAELMSEIGESTKTPEKIQLKSCPNCGKENKGGNKFCEDCGNKFEQVKLDVAMQEKKPVAPKLDSEMEARVVEEASLLDEKGASKKFLAEERQQLAQEIREQRKLQRERLTALKLEIESANKNENAQQGDARYGKISEMLSRMANMLAEKLGLSTGLDKESAQEEREDIAQLIDASAETESIKTKLEAHYAKADEIAKNKFESVRKTVEQTLVRNNAFIVHTFLLNEKLRHNANSNISSRATIEDDIDLLLSLEPSISTSSVVPGSRQGLWNEDIGVIIGGGDIRGGVQTDGGTTTGGIKERNGRISDSQEIDGIVSDKSARGYNELVVNNPKVFGFFKNVSVDESGKMTGFSASESENEKKENKEEFMKYLNIAKEKGMPQLVMTPDRKLFEFLSIDDDGVVSIGLEITPQQVALGNAGLSNEKRKTIGEKIISKNLFRYIDHQKEAKGIVAELSGQEGADTELSKEEYLNYAKDNDGSFHRLPKHLLADKEFMMEAAQFDPVSAYEYAGEDLKRDINFIKQVYSLDKKGRNTVYAYMPEDLKIDESVASLAIENGDFKDLDYALADSPIMWEKIVDKIVEEKNPDKWFSRNVGEDQIISTYFPMHKGFDSVDMSEKLIADENFIQKLNTKYPNYKFDIDEYKQLVITKLI